MADEPRLFETALPVAGVDEALPERAPLAARMRPRTLDEFVGQARIIGPGTALRAAVEQRKIPSAVFWGPPGSGKTTLARLLANAVGARFVAMSAVTAGVADLRRVVGDAKLARARSTIVFIDEIHRFNKAQQDAILPHVERGDITFIGATTENPSFEVISALLSRSRVFVLAQLSAAEIGAIVDRALADAQRGLGGRVALDPEARARLIALSDGDARSALNALELAAEIASARKAAAAVVSPRDVEEAMQRRALRYDRAGDEHYDLISAFIKSVRGSDPHAAVYWLARMLEAGEDPMFVARRLTILAAEDVGLGDPQALPVATAAHYAAHSIGMPEAMLPLVEATIYLALAKKSNSGLRAYVSAVEAIEETGTLPVPLHLRNAVTGLMRELGYGRGYQYAHDFPDAKTDQQHLPDELKDRKFFEP